MPNDCITYQESGYFSKLISDYLDEKPELRTLYNRFPTIENFKSQIEEKSVNFNVNNNNKRQILVSELENQYQNFEVSETTLYNIELLKNSNTFTITTGHQLNLFTGPIYFLYKIISTINLCKELKQNYPNHDFVPIYWMASEDHDFEEINYFKLNGKKIKWNRESSGPVGRLSTEGLQDVFDEFTKEIGIGKNADYLKALFKKSYLEHINLAEAIRFLVNELFKDEGLVIIDGDSAELKKLFIPYAKKELLEQNSFVEVKNSIEKLSAYQIQVNPREINLFYIEDNLRERIILENEIYKVNNTSVQFSKSEILELLINNPQKFSPNVILRPLYQEIILPNLCYVGGGGELAYWLELKSTFEVNNIVFPILLLRNSVVLLSEKQQKKMDKLNLIFKELFINQNELLNLKTKKLSKFTIDFTLQKEYLKKQFEALLEIAKQTDNSFLGAVKAQEAKQIKGLSNLEKRLQKAEKRIFKESLNRIISLQEELFPNKSLQERQLNFSELYVEFGENFIKQLVSNLKPLENSFTLIKI